MREKSYENKIKDYLKSIGAYFIKTHGDRFSKSGIPDILACVNGKFVAVEVKGDGGKPSELQLLHLKMIEKASGLGYIVAPKSEIPKIDKFISENYPKYVDDIVVVDLEDFKKDMKFLLTSQ